MCYILIDNVQKIDLKGKITLQPDVIVDNDKHPLIFNKYIDCYNYHLKHCPNARIVRMNDNYERFIKSFNVRLGYDDNVHD